jgi:hypothetical protein
MTLLLLLSLPFAGVGAWSGRRWTLILPFAFWFAFGWLQGVGVLPGTSSMSALLLAAAIGAVFTGFGIAVHARLRPRAT